MALNIINRLKNALNTLDQAIITALGSRFPPGSIGAFAQVFDGSAYPPSEPRKQFSLKDLLDDGFLWGVPKTRRPIEKRLCRKFGDPERHWKMLVPKSRIAMCPSCGHDYEITTLCKHCYEKVKTETNEMKDAIQAALKLEPVEKNVVVIYENERENKDEEFWKTQRVVEMPKKRPNWFHSNLTQPTTQQPSDSRDVKPTELA